MQNNDYNKNLCVLCDENNNHFNLIVHKSEINLIKQLDINLKLINIYNYDNK
jgi:hypothetical protein